MTLLRMMYLWMSHPPPATWKMDVSGKVPVAERMMNGRKMSDEKTVLRNSTGMTALSRSDFFLNES